MTRFTALETHAAEEFSHEALLYRGSEQWLEAIRAFVEPGLAAGEPVMIAVPRAKHEMLRSRLGGQASAVTLLDMTPLGRNPARLIGAYTEALAAHPGRRAHLVGEPAWPGRTADENAEVIVHEALCNLAFKGLPYRALCPYDVEAIDPSTLAGVRDTHPLLAEGLGAAHPSPSYTEPVAPSPRWPGPLVPPPSGATYARYTLAELRRVRRLVRRRAMAVGLAPAKRRDFVLAVDELATNSILHAGGHGELRIWTSESRLVCEIKDHGHIPDPLAGRIRPPADNGRGRGLWLVNQLADLVQLRTQPGGTTIRIHIALTD